MHLFIGLYFMSRIHSCLINAIRIRLQSGLGIGYHKIKCEMNYMRHNRTYEKVLKCKMTLKLENVQNF